ncbi:GNAT family N-acetyltransferase [Pseudonocardia nematodicida]|uniref:GNAT family N-acetyltransferase n=1 Tax=Pseudonocardia nematodicida TaxID=1206997 RepID=A0ABV1KB44_9PSEU
MTPPAITLRPLSRGEFDAFWSVQEVEYLDAVRTALPEDTARAKVRDDLERLLPEGPDTPGHRLLGIEDELGDVVGQVWLALTDPRTGSTEVAWLYQIRIEEPFRRRGYARAALRAVEGLARDAGAQQLGLNVFGANTAAIALYESCGYAVTTQQMARTLTGGTADIVER